MISVSYIVCWTCILLDSWFSSFCNLVSKTHLTIMQTTDDGKSSQTLWFLHPCVTCVACSCTCCMRLTYVHVDFTWHCEMTCIHSLGKGFSTLQHFLPRFMPWNRVSLAESPWVLPRDFLNTDHNQMEISFQVGSAFNWGRKLVKYFFQIDEVMTFGFRPVDLGE